MVSFTTWHSTNIKNSLPSRDGSYSAAGFSTSRGYICKNVSTLSPYTFRRKNKQGLVNLIALCCCGNGSISMCYFLIQGLSLDSSKSPGGSSIIPSLWQPESRQCGFALLLFIYQCETLFFMTSLVSPLKCPKRPSLFSTSAPGPLGHYITLLCGSSELLQSLSGL